MTTLGARGWMGPKMKAWVQIMDYSVGHFFSSSFTEPHSSVSEKLKKFKNEKEFWKQCYRKHNTYVINTVPKDNLLGMLNKDGNHCVNF